MRSVDAIFLTNTSNDAIYRMTRAAIDSLLREWPTANVIVVETNHSQCFGQYPGSVLEPREPFNYNKFMNYGIRYGKSDFVLMCNNDIVFEPGSIKCMVEAMDKYMLDSLSPWEPSWHPSRFAEVRPTHLGYTIEREVCGWCIMARRSMLERLQPLDEQFEFWAQDLDYAKTLQVNQVRHALIRDANVRHKFSVSHGLLGDKKEHMTHEQVRRFHRKWAAKVETPKPKVFDCFTFFNELDLLQLRVAELSDVVDHFVLVEAGQTFTGKPKSFIFYENRKAFPSTIHSVLMPSLPGNDAWAREHCQRNQIVEGLRQLDAQPHDIVLISDVDEIPDPSIMSSLMEIQEPVNLDQALYYYNLTCRCRERWTKAKAVRFNEFEKRTANEIRMTHYPRTLPKGGWHLSYFGDTEFIKQKVAAFSHQEFNNERYMQDEKIEKAMKEGLDLFGRTVEFQREPIQSNPYLPKHYNLLRHLV